MASSLYIVIASNPMNEKHTTVAPAATAWNCTPACTSGSSVKIVPWPMPFRSASHAWTTNAQIITIWNTTRNPLIRDVPFMLKKFSAVIAAT